MGGSNHPQDAWVPGLFKDSPLRHGEQGTAAKAAPRAALRRFGHPTALDTDRPIRPDVRRQRKYPFSLCRHHRKCAFILVPEDLHCLVFQALR